MELNFFLSLLVFVPLLLLLYVASATLYLLALACAYLKVRERAPGAEKPLNRFAVIVPAHNEELLVATLCRSLLEVDYPREKYAVYVVADNCSDATAKICREYPVTVLERFDPDNAGKGQALAWALQQCDLAQFDAVFMVDADNYVDKDILRQLNRHINDGEQALQCYNAVGNRVDSWFTQLLYVSRTIGNLLYHEAKHRLGLSAYLMGNGLCFRADLLRRKGWTAFSTGEDWEYYTQLVQDGIRIGFAAQAKVFHQESKSLGQATSQRLRWASGRFAVARHLGLPLFFKGIRERSWMIVDAAFPLLFPNYSLLVNLTLAGGLLAVFLPTSTVRTFLLLSYFLCILGQASLFAAGAVIAGSFWKTCTAVVFVPCFLVWKAVIDILCVTGVYRGRKWIRTRRH